MNAVIEIDEIRQVVHAAPSDRLSSAPALAYGLQIGAVRPNLRVAVHTRFSWRDSGIRQFLDCGMTVATINRLVSGVMFVAELYGLFAWKEGLSVV